MLRISTGHGSNVINNSSLDTHFARRCRLLVANTVLTSLSLLFSRRKYSFAEHSSMSLRRSVSLKSKGERRRRRRQLEPRGILLGKLGIER